MAKKRKVIITCALTGSVHTPSMSPYLPVTADAIGQAGLEAAEAGAAILHLHAREPEEGRPSQDPEDFRPFMEKLNANTDAVLNITTGGSPFMTIDERLQPCLTFAPEVASLNMGSMNFGHVPDAEPIQGLQVRLGEGVLGDDPRLGLQEHLQGHRDRPDPRGG